jgi:hypothetical protein
MRSLKLLPFIVLCSLLASCAQHSPTPKEIICYRYENSLDLRGDNTLNHVVVVGYDDAKLGEATRLVVSTGGAPLTLRNQIDVNGAMYHPSVELTKKGNLLVRWGVIDDCAEQVELAADPAGNLTVVKRTQKKS